MPLLGAHLSIAGGYHRAVEAAAELRMQVVQLFTKNNNQWNAKPITDAEADAFRQALQRTGISHPLSHDSYLINLGSSDSTLWNRSVDAFTVELERASQLAIPNVVMHPGAATGSTEAEALAQVIAALREALRRTTGSNVRVLVETTAGQGTSLGWRFEHLAQIFQGVQAPERLGVCVDTCHVVAAGYSLDPQAGYDETFDTFDRLVGVRQIQAFHLNDSKKPLGSRVDRHAHLGEGYLGWGPFWRLMNDARFQHLPMYLETPKEDRDGEPMDAINLRGLQSLVGASAPPASSESFALTSQPAPLPKTKSSAKPRAATKAKRLDK